MTLFGAKNRSLALRKRKLTDNADGGNYHVLELAFIETINDQEYVNSVGIAGRSDEVSEDVRALQKAEDIKRRKRQEALDLTDAPTVS